LQWLVLVALLWCWRASMGRLALVLALVGALVYGAAAWLLPQLLWQWTGFQADGLLGRFTDGGPACTSRRVLWANVLHLIAQKPWLGWGWGELDYAHYITLFPGERFCTLLDNAHNLPLHLAVELGVPVALLACALAAWLVWRGRPWAEQHPARQLAWGVLLAIGLHSLVEYPLWYGPFQIAVAICVWLLWATRAGAAAQRGSHVPPPGRPKAEAAPSGGSAAGAAAQRGGHFPAWVRHVAASALLCGLAYVGWDYHRISQVYLPAEQRSAAYRDDPMGQAQKSWLYADVVRFADLTSRPATRDNAAWMLPTALQTLHFSPEPRVIIKLIESASYLGRDDLALAHLARFHAAFAREHRAWMDENERLLRSAQAGLGAAPGVAASAAASAASGGASAAP
jgi:hypothetical protein